MGVPGLWPILQPAASVSTLAKLADEAFRSKPGTRGFIVGVDAAIWIFHSRKLLGIPDAGECVPPLFTQPILGPPRLPLEVQTRRFTILDTLPSLLVLELDWNYAERAVAGEGRGRHGSARASSSLLLTPRPNSQLHRLMDASLTPFFSHRNPDLRTLFYRLAALMSRGILPLFVFDGPNKPRWKRGKEAKRAPWETKLIRNFKEMIDLMGGHWRVAQGEAEADLAAFAMAGEIDAVITDDVDTLVFGGTMVGRIPQEREKQAEP